MIPETDGPVRWEELDQRLLSPRLQKIADKMQKKATEEEVKIISTIRRLGNRGAYFSELFNFQEQLTDEWVQQVFDAYCEAWQEQNRSVSGQFIRLVRDRVVLPLIAARKAAVQHGVSLRAIRAGDMGGVDVLGDWSRRVDCVAVRWARELEAKAAASEYSHAAATSKHSPDTTRESDAAVPSSSGHPLSLTRCAVCLHYQCYHDEQGCFLDPKGKKSRDPGFSGRAALKTTGSQCWCPKFVRDADDAADLVLQLGDSGALMQGAVAALDRADRRNTRRLIDQYIVKTPVEQRDSDWVKAMQRRLETQASDNPIKGENPDDFTKLPAMLKEPSIDPIEPNPFPESHPASKIWAEATCKASEEVLRFRAEMLGGTAPNDPVGRDEWFVRLIVGQFDIWAKRFVHVVWTESMFENFARWLVSYAESWLDSCRQMKFPPRHLDSFLATLRRSLMARTEWWKAEARRHLSLLEKGASELDARERNPSIDIRHVRAKIDQNVKQQDSPHIVSLQYPRSETKRLIALQLTKHPSGKDVEICLALDDDGVELPRRWQSEFRTRSFHEAYSDRKARNKIEQMISKVRHDMRAKGLLNGK